MKRLITYLLPLFAFSLSAQNWEQVAPVANNFTSDHSFGFAINGIGYLVTGYAKNENKFSDQFYSYDPSTDTWTQKDPFPGASRGFAIGDVFQGKAYLGFGSDDDNVFNDLWEYDPQSDTWTELAFCPCIGREHPALVTLDGYIYVGLGNDGSSNLKDWWRYDIANNTWEQKTDFMDNKRHHPYQFAVGEYVYVGFGHGVSFISNKWYYRYDPSTDTWKEVASLPSNGRVAGTQFSYNGYGYTLSGEGENHGAMPTGEFWEYDPSIDSWSALPPHPEKSRWAPASFIIDGYVYIINGYDGSYIDKVYKFNLETIYVPKLRLIAPSTENLVSTNTSDDYCNPFWRLELVINTPIPFDEDVQYSIETDTSSTAIEGRDFIVPNSNGVLPIGETSTTLEILVFDDAMFAGKKRLL